MSDLDNAWAAVRDELTQLAKLVDAGAPVDLLRFAEAFSRLARAYHVALSLQGKTSMRIEVVLRALDLKTPKSALLAFLGRQ